jgi:hypothetical protein
MEKTMSKMSLYCPFKDKKSSSGPKTLTVQCSTFVYMSLKNILKESTEHTSDFVCPIHEINKLRLMLRLKEIPFKLKLFFKT